MAKEYLVATFADPDALVTAVTSLRAHGFKIYDVYAPFPVHGLDEAMGLRRSRLGWVTLVAGALGLSSAIGLQVYAAVFDWSLNVGGKPDNSTLAFIPITFELTILAGGLATAFAFFLQGGLFPGATARLAAPRVTDDVFAVALRWRETVFDTGEARRVLHDSGALDISQTAGDL
jgi:ActD protein